MQVFKFGCYISIPILMTIFVAGNPGRLESIIKNVLPLDPLSPCIMMKASHEPIRTMSVSQAHKDVLIVPSLDFVQRAYVVYPPEGQRPPTAEELIDRINKNSRKQ